MTAADGTVKITPVGSDRQVHANVSGFEEAIKAIGTLL